MVLEQIAHDELRNAYAADLLLLGPDEILRQAHAAGVYPNQTALRMDVHTCVQRLVLALAKLEFPMQGR